jgi:putative toxin-antitoxin system antitoxin component (TIGR02293 family)
MTLAAGIDDFTKAERPERVAAIEAGLPVKMLRVVMRDYGFTLANLAGRIAPRRTLERRLENGERLNLEESERLARLMRMLDLAREIFGDPTRVRDWLSEPKRTLGGRIPLDLMRTEEGGRVLEERLLQLKYGIYA